MPQECYFPTIRQLAEYEVWCNAATITTARGLDEKQIFQPFPFGLGTIHKTLFHTVNVFRTWSACVGPDVHKPQPPEI